MENGRKKLRFEIFFDRFFSNFGRILLTNLLFAVPSATVFVGLYFLNQAIFGGINIPFSMIAILALYPFYAGVVAVVRDIVKGEKNISVVKTYFSSIRNNFLPFLLHGVIICGASVLSYFALTVYIGLLHVSWLMYVLLFFCILIVLLAFFSTFYLPLMTLTYDLKLRYQYKNSFLMSFGEFKNNFFAGLSIAILVALCLTLTMLPSVTALIIVLAALWSLFIPATATFCYVFFVYDGMVDIIANKEELSREIEAKIGEKVGKRPADKPQLPIEEEDYSDIDISQLKDSDDFIFHNGRMIKQSTLLRILREKEAANQEENHE